jgi:hypothetical protein
MTTRNDSHVSQERVSEPSAAYLESAKPVTLL